MASLKAQKAAAPAFMPGDGRAVNLTDKVVLGAAGVGTPAVADTIDFFVPGGSRVCDLFFIGDQVDSNGSPTLAFNVGYRPVNSGSSLAAAPTYFATGSTAFRVAGPTRLQPSFKPIKFEEDVFITLTITAVAATLVNASEIHMVADVNCEGAK